MRLIDADELLECEFFIEDEDGFQESVVLAEDIGKLPTVDAAPVVHAHWRHTCPGTYPDGRAAREGIQCSACFYRAELAQKAKYCPNCGAKMDEEVEL